MICDTGGERIAEYFALLDEGGMMFCDEVVVKDGVGVRFSEKGVGSISFFLRYSLSAVNKHSTFNLFQNSAESDKAAMRSWFSSKEARIIPTTRSRLPCRSSTMLRLLQSEDKSVVSCRSGSCDVSPTDVEGDTSARAWLPVTNRHPSPSHSHRGVCEPLQAAWQGAGCRRRAAKSQR